MLIEESEWHRVCSKKVNGKIDCPKTTEHGTLQSMKQGSILNHFKEYGIIEAKVAMIRAAKLAALSRDPAIYKKLTMNAYTNLHIYV